MVSLGQIRLMVVLRHLYMDARKKNRSIQANRADLEPNLEGFALNCDLELLRSMYVD